MKNPGQSLLFTLQVFSTCVCRSTWPARNSLFFSVCDDHRQTVGLWMVYICPVISKAPDMVYVDAFFFFFLGKDISLNYFRFFLFQHMKKFILNPSTF